VITLKKPTDTISVSAGFVDSGSYDNCQVTDLQLLKNTFTIANVGLNEVTLVVTDWQKNKNACFAIVKVETKGFTNTNQPFPWPISLSPNPSYGLFEVKWAEAAPAPDAIRVYNTLGSIVWETNTTQTPTASIDLREQTAGAYIVQLRAGSYIHTEMLVVVK
jgi:hypothetical protein